jgi:bifunctional oligoribonuclease and PAP phosphatase NrnA
MTAGVAAHDWARAVKILDAAAGNDNRDGEVCLACHVRPDADALGSMLAVALALRGRLAGGVAPRVIASFGDEPFAVPPILRFLPGLDLLTEPAQFPVAPRVMLTFDAASIDRLGLLAGSAVLAAELIVLDHHPSYTRFGGVHLVDPAAAATAVLAAELIDRLGIDLTADIALCLYAGLVADTGSFKYEATSPAVHQLAARLIGTGIEPGMVARELWDRAPYRQLGLLSAVLGRAELDQRACAGYGLVWTTVTRADRSTAGLGLDAAESVIDLLRRTDEAEIAVVLKEADSGEWQVSVRSKGNVDVSRACAALGGGGHRAAAGFAARGAPADVLAALIAQLDHG